MVVEGIMKSRTDAVWDWLINYMLIILAGLFGFSAVLWILSEIWFHNIRPAVETLKLIV